jgi:hypothetical protein
MGDDWHLDRLEVTHLPSGRAWKFAWGNWVPKTGALMSAVVSAASLVCERAWKEVGCRSTPFSRLPLPGAGKLTCTCKNTECVCHLAGHE